MKRQWFYDPSPFVKLVQKVLVGNYEPIVDICEKIFIINLHNLQILFMLWTKYQFSEFLAGCTNMKPPLEDFLATVLSRSADTGVIRGQFSPNFFVYLQILLCSEKFALNI